MVGSQSRLMKRDRFDLRFDHSDNTKPSAVRRVEVISGPERRRSWSDEEKLEIVAELCGQGVVLQQHFAVAEDVIHRRPQVVADA